MLCETLRLIRMMHGAKAKDLAVELGISPGYLSEIERGIKKPTLELVYGYAKRFCVKPSTIFFFDERREERRETDFQNLLYLFAQSVNHCERKTSAVTPSDSQDPNPGT